MLLPHAIVEYGERHVKFTHRSTLGDILRASKKSDLVLGQLESNPVAFESPSDFMGMNYTVASERYSKGAEMPPWTMKEHHARYEMFRGMIAGKDVVDCACGSGELSSIPRSAGARSVVGVDVDPGAIEFANANFSGQEKMYLWRRP